MTLSPQKIGDRGQRYAVIMKMKDGEEKAFGWCEQRKVADEMKEACEKWPIVESARVDDRKPGEIEPPSVELIAQLLMDRLNVLIGRPFTIELIDEIDDVCQDFTRQFNYFPRMMVIILPGGYVEVVEQFQRKEDVASITQYLKLKYPQISEETVFQCLEPHIKKARLR